METQLDGIYIIRTSLEASDLGAAEAVEAYGSLSQIEQAFRSVKAAQLDLCPVFVYSENHVRGHVFLCLLAYYLKRHLRQRLAPLLFDEEDPREKGDSPLLCPSLLLRGEKPNSGLLALIF